ncbi:MAG: replicative DNA helicase, partial [Clostridia bacterium]|nr:replicative DNA helicase [Clostridia bacterium]
MPMQNNEAILDRKLPFSLSAEQALLGSILIDPNALNEVADLIQATDFYITEHTQIYLAMRELFLTNNEIDVVTLVDTLVRQGLYEKSGGQDYIRTLAEAVPSAMNVKDYARIVKDKSTLRQLIDACSDISESAYSEQDSVASVIDSAENRIFSIAQGRDTKNFRHIREVLGS